ncbi:MAG: pyridoxamine 5'-phosphate oxidase family protein, partial [Actinomycetota bacterium]
MPSFPVSGPVSGSAPGPPTARTQVRRHPERGDYDPVVVHAILDEALICHLAYVAEDGSPRVIPTIHT